MTLGELAVSASSVLDILGVAAGNGQVRDRPDERTIRYYTTLGLVDRPAATSGRTALYGQRHLLQVVALKALQARGHTLATLQRELPGAGDADLRRLAGPEIERALGEAMPGSGTPAEGRREAFWRAVPAQPAPPATVAVRAASPVAVPASVPAAGAPASGPAAPAARRRLELALAPGVDLLVTTDAGAAAVDPVLLARAAAPLLDLLAALQPGSGPRSTPPAPTKEPRP